MKSLFFFLFIFLSIGIVGAAVNIGDENTKGRGVKILPPPFAGSIFSNNSGAVNSSEFWLTNLGALDNANSTQFSNNGGFLNIVENFIQGLINSTFTRSVEITNGSLTQVIVPGSLNQVGNIAVGDNPSHSFVYGTFVFVADPFAFQLFVIDISNPLVPKQISNLTIGGNVNGIAASGNFVYLIDSADNNLLTIDVSNPFAPNITDNLALNTTTANSIPNGIYVQGRFAYVVDEVSDDLKVIDISNPTNASITANISVGPKSSRLTVFRRYAYILDSTDDNLRIVDINNPTNPVSLSTISVGDGPFRITVENLIASITHITTNSLFFVNVTDPRNPTIYDNFTVSSRPSAIFQSGNLVYVGLGGSGTPKEIRVYNITDPENVEEIDKLEFGNTNVVRDLYVSGIHAYFFDGQDDEMNVIAVTGVDAVSGWFRTLKVNVLQIEGSAVIQNQLTVLGGINAEGGLFTSGLSVEGGPLSAPSAFFSESVIIGKDLNVSGDVNITGELKVDGESTFSKKINVNNTLNFTVPSGSNSIIGSAGSITFEPQNNINFRGDGDYAFFLQDNNDDFTIQSSTEGIQFRIENEGFVDIPSTTPLCLGTFGGSPCTHKLSVQGGVNFTSSFEGDGNFSVNDNTLFINYDLARVGIGTATPETLLDVQGTSNLDGNVTIDGILTIDTTNGNDPFTLTRSGRANEGATFHIDDSGLRVVSIQDEGNSGAVEFKLGGNTAGNFNQRNFLVRNSDDTLLFTIEPAGNVGIGTDNPADALAVVGDINVSGCIEEADGTLIGGTCVSGREFKENEQSFIMNWTAFNLVKSKTWDWKQPNITVERERSFFNETTNKTERQTYIDIIDLQYDSGFIYEDVLLAYPDRVREVDGVKSVSYSFDWILDLRTAVQDLFTWNTDQDAEIADLEARIAILEGK